MFQLPSLDLCSAFNSLGHLLVLGVNLLDKLLIGFVTKLPETNVSLLFEHFKAFLYFLDGKLELVYLLLGDSISLWIDYSLPTSSRPDLSGIILCHFLYFADSFLHALDDILEPLYLFLVLSYQVVGFRELVRHLGLHGLVLFFTELLLIDYFPNLPSILFVLLQTVLNLVPKLLKVIRIKLLKLKLVNLLLHRLKIQTLKPLVNLSLFHLNDWKFLQDLIDLRLLFRRNRIQIPFSLSL